jgi:glutaminyl-peptide cyclotransferase
MSGAYSFSVIVAGFRPVSTKLKRPYTCRRNDAMLARFRCLILHISLAVVLLSSCTYGSHSPAGAAGNPPEPAADTARTNPSRQAPAPTFSQQYPQFDRASAFDYLKAQCDFGARIPGSQAHADCLAWLIQRLRDTTDAVIVQPFKAATPFGGPYKFTNIIAYYDGDAEQAPIMFGAHWDCRPQADEDPDPVWRNRPVMGANDGASGVAVLLEMVRVAAVRTDRRPFIVAFFDAEDSGKQGATHFELDGWALGSAYMAKNMPTDFPTPEALIVLDLVGQDEVHNKRLGTPNGSNDRLDFPIEEHSMQSAPGLVNEIWTIAESAGHTAFVRTRCGQITDDHVPFIRQGIPAIDIIDLPHPEWHTAEDTPDCCSADSLYQVGDTLLRYLYGVRQ